MTASQQSARPAPTCILNGKSVHLQAACGHVERASREFGVETQVVITKRGDDVSALAARALGERRHPIVAGGGDGTVNAVAGTLAGTDTPLGVLPMGTLNHFAKDAGIPLDLGAAVRNLFTGRATKVDLGEVNGRVFVNNSGVGFYPHFVRQREEQERRGHVKKVAFVIAVKAGVRRYFRLRLRSHMDRAEAIEQFSPFLFVGNNRYRTSGRQIGTRATLDSGRLWVCTAPKSGSRNILGVVLRTLLGGPTDQDLKVVEVEEISVDPGTVRVNVSTDGEVSVMDAPLHYRIRPRALDVLVPERDAGHGASPG
jgi:diacylglycerol kinase family enzyme